MAEALAGIRGAAARPQLSRVPRSRRPDLIAVGVLLLLPLLSYLLPAVMGGVVQPGDDYDQNFPLRVLVGRQLAHGMWPLLDPYTWSGGSPLLGGWNAGAAYPLTWLFAILPATAAWVFGQLFTYWTAGLGLYAYLRNRDLGAAPAFLGAMVFAFGGAFEIQVEHIGLVAGASWIPLMLLAADKVAAEVPLRRRAHWTVLLGVAGGMCILSGEPRAITIAALVMGVYGIWLFVRSGVRRSLLASAAAAGLLALLLGAMQLLPGLAVVDDSQRATGGYELFAAGSMQPGWLSLLLNPMLLGGRGTLGLPDYLGSYNLPEIASYVGLFPIVAAFALTAGLRRRGGTPPWVIWLIMAAVGLLTALGGETPLGHLLYHIPLFGGQRLQSRNIMVTDLALAVLLAYWLQAWSERGATARAASDRAPRDRASRWSLVPVGLALVLGAATLIAPAPVVRVFGAQGDLAHQASRLWPASVAFVAVALLVGAVLLLGRRWSPRARTAAVVVVTCLDLLFAVVLASERLWVPPGSGSSHSVTVAGSSVDTVPLQVPMSRVGKDARFLVYGPDGIGSFDVGGVGDPDLNVLTRSYSMQGYSALLNAHYADTTGTHKASGAGHNTVSTTALGDGTLDQLAARYLFVQPRYLMSRSDGDVAPEKSDAPRAVGTAAVTWNLGELVRIDGLWAPLPAGGHGLQVGLVGADGHTRWLAPGRIRAAGGRLHVHLPAATDVVALRARTDSGSIPVGVPRLQLSDGRTFAVDGGLQDALSRHHWRFAGNVNGYALFLNPTAGPALSARSADGTAQVQRIAGDRLLPTAARVSSGSGATVLRSVSAIPGWRATWTPQGSGTSTSLPVRRDGLIQAVTVPSGTGTLRWSYVPKGWHAGLAATAAGLAVIVAYALSIGVSAARRRSGRGPNA